MRIKRQVLFWVPSKNSDKERTSKPLEHETITEEDLIAEFGVPHFIIQDHLKTEVQQEAACKTVPFTLLLVVSYAWMVIAHMDAPVLRAVEDSVRHDVADNANFAFDSIYYGHKDIEDVNSYADFWSFMQQGLIPLLFIQERQWSEDVVDEHLYPDGARRLNSEFHKVPLDEPWLPINATRRLTALEDRRPFEALPEERWGLLLNYNRIVGGLRLRQERSPEKSCDMESGLADFYGELCTGDRYPTDPDMNEARSTDADESATRWIWVNTSQDLISAQLIDMELNGWLDRKTAKIEISIPIYNGEYGLHSLICVNFYFSRGGRIWKHIIPESCYVRWYSRWYHYLSDSIYACCILWILGTEVWSMVRATITYGCHGLYEHYFNVWNVIDWLSVLTGIVLMWLLFTVVTLTMELNDTAQKIISPEPLDVHLAVQYVDKLEVASDWVVVTQRSLAYYPMIIVFRLFKAFHAQPRLSLVTITLRDCMQDLLHFLVVFTCVFLGFVTSGMVLFGRDNENFATFPRSCLACCRLLLGDIEWDELKISSRLIAGLWIVAFFVVMVQLLLNMLLAVIMDSYSEVKEQAGSARTLLAETMRLCMKWWAAKQGNYIPLNIILHAMDHALETKLGEKMVSRKKKRRGSGDAASGMSVAQSEASDGITEDVFRAQIGRTPLFVNDLITLTGNHKLMITGAKGVELSLEQANLILREAVVKYYNANKERVDMAEVLTVSRKVEAVMRGLIKSWWSASRQGRDDPDHQDVDQLLHEMREGVESFMDEVQAERSKAAQTLARLRTEVAMLQEWARLAKPAGLSGPVADRLRAANMETARAQAAARGGAARGGRLQPLEEEPGGGGGREDSGRHRKGRRASNGHEATDYSNGDWDGGGVLPAGWQQGDSGRDAVNLDWPDGVSLPSSAASKASGASSHSGDSKGSLEGLEDLSGSEDLAEDAPPARLGATAQRAGGVGLTDSALSTLDQGPPRDRQGLTPEGRQEPPPQQRDAFEFTNFKDAQSQIRSMLVRMQGPEQGTLADP
mmetsp:Transcript_44462/g.81176  ORF Transcript_44462/g.81176 Transcript_44462/m.81176 type:complete len:1029 (-) Transcript_44462:49-3135(-)